MFWTGMNTTSANASTKPISAEALELARTLAKEFRDCMWWRHPDATVETWDDACRVVKHLREYGGHRAWREAQRLWKCL
jgi:hypothetical protein